LSASYERRFRVDFESFSLSNRVKKPQNFSTTPTALHSKLLFENSFSFSRLKSNENKAASVFL
jgi:hypothetical protein